MTRRPPRSPLFPYTTLFRSWLRPMRSRFVILKAAISRRTARIGKRRRSEEHTSELQSQFHLLFPLFFFNDPAPTEISPLPLHDALPILVAPDEITFRYLEGRDFSPNGENCEKAVSYWQSLKSDPKAKFDKVINLKAEDIAPQVTWGTSPGQVISIDALVPDPNQFVNPVERQTAIDALKYMDLKPGTPINSIAVDKVFIGSCTNGRIEDLRVAAHMAKGKKVFPKVQGIVVPGSGRVRRQAEAEGLDKIFTEAGFEWRFAGCSMCLGMNDDQLKKGERCASTSNRNFEGRQGPGGRTHLMSPQMAVVAAIEGKISDVRKYLQVTKSQ